MAVVEQDNLTEIMLDVLLVEMADVEQEAQVKLGSPWPKSSELRSTPSPAAIAAMNASTYTLAIKE